MMCYIKKAKASEKSDAFKFSICIKVIDQYWLVLHRKILYFQ